MSIELPRVLENGSYSRRLHPVSGSANLTLQPLSNVRLKLPKEDEISALDWVQIYTPDGGSGYYRVQSVSIDAVTGEQEAELEHGACTLEDGVIATDSKKTDTISNLLTFILSGQNRWTVGTVQATRTIFMNLGGSSPLDEISEMMGSIPDYQAVFVQNGENDWHIDILQRPSTAVCEARLSRNMESCSISYSVQEMVTRVYADGITNGHMDSANIAVYGLREHKQSLDKSLSKAQKEEIVSAYLANHDHPAVSIRISGVELSQITGLTLDQFQLGAVCRVALPWLGITQDQVITEKRYQDIYTAPEKVEITLANAVPDLSLSVASISRSGSRTSKKLDKESVVVDELVATALTADDLEAMDITVASLHAGYVSVHEGGVVLDDTADSVTASAYYMNESDGDLVDSIKAVQIIQVSGTNSFKLQFKTFSGDEWTDAGTFSRATTLTGAWASGKYTVTASPQGDEISTTPNMQLNGSNQESFSAELLTDESTPAVTNRIYGYLGISGSGSSRVVKVYKDQAKTQAVAQIAAPTTTYSNSSKVTRYSLANTDDQRIYTKTNGVYSPIGSQTDYAYTASTTIPNQQTVHW